MGNPRTDGFSNYHGRTDDDKGKPPMREGMTLEVLDYRVSVLEEDRRRFLAALETLVLLGASVGETQRGMAVANENAQKLGEWIEAVDKRVQGLEVAQPMLESTAALVRRGVVGIFGIFAAVVVGVILAFVK